MKKFYRNLLIEKPFKIIFIGDKIYFIGLLGCLRYSLNDINLSFFKLIDNYKSFVKISINQKFLRTFFKFFLKNIYGVSFGWFMNIEFEGRGFHIFTSENYLKLNLGFSHVILFKIPKSIKIKCLKRNLYLYSINMNKVFNLSRRIRNLRRVDSYKGKGIFLSNEKVILKVGKKM